MQVRSLGQEAALEKGIATQSHGGRSLEDYGSHGAAKNRTWLSAHMAAEAPGLEPQVLVFGLLCSHLSMSYWLNC